MPDHAQVREIFALDTDVLSGYLSNVKIEVEILKVKAWRRDDAEMLECLYVVDRAIELLMDVQLEFVERQPLVN